MPDLNNEQSQARRFYLERRDAVAGNLSALNQRDKLFTRIRLLLFMVAAVSFTVGGFGVVWPPAAHIVGIFFTVAFLALVVRHEDLLELKQETHQLKQLNDHLLARLERRWHDFPEPEVTVPREHRAVAGDLDLFGHASLFQMINLACTPAGLNNLRDWLLVPGSPDDVSRRQESVRELTDQRALREEVFLQAGLVSDGLASPDAFVGWAEGPAWLDRRNWLKVLSRTTPIISIVILAAIAFQLVAPLMGAAALVALIIGNTLLSVLLSGPVHDIFNSVSSRSGEVNRYHDLFQLVAELECQSEMLCEIREHMHRHPRNTLGELKKLRRVMGLANLRHAGMWSVFYFLFQAWFLWDFHVLALLETWKRRCGEEVRGWFDALARLESLCSFASWAQDNPDWQYPTVEPGNETIAASGLGHPLLPDEHRVCNDVKVGPSGTLLLVTGSNMSGKSTLLRALGVNAVLAQAGAPVCAKTWSMGPVEVTTSMRIHDSLEDGVSYYMAELRRLKEIVDQARLFRDRSERMLFYLLDEILQGTNSKERHIAVCRVLAHLVDNGAIGAVSTHDLDLATSPQLADGCQAVHFRESLHDDPDQPMTFDYRMRPGVATTTNALKLLEIVGLS